MKTTITGSFDIALAPQSDAQFPAGRLTIDKRYHGNLDASGKGQMLSARTATEGSAGYVALELVNGTLAGKKGAFSLLHRGLMSRGTSQLSVTVIPDSGTDELLGLAGEMVINIVDGAHFYEFTYAFTPNE